MEIDRNATCEITADDYVNLSVFDLLSRAKNGDVLAQQVLSRTTRPANKMNKYDENQPRDERGRFSSTAGESDTGVESMRDLAGDVSEQARLYSVQNQEELERRGLVSFGNAVVTDLTLSQYAPAVKAIIAINIAERMKDEPIESIVAAIPEIGYPANYDAIRSVSAAELLSAITDSNQGIIYDGTNLTVVKDKASDEYPENNTRYYDQEGKEQAVREYFASAMIASWAGSSNDSRENSLAMQERAAELFGLEDYADWEIDDATQERVDNLTGEHGLIIDSFLQAQYDATQEFLRSSGITELSLTRGTSLASSWTSTSISQGKGQDVAMRPLSSWSTSFGVSSGFGTHTLVATFPAERIFSLPITGLGCLNEQEVVVLGGTIKADVEDNYAGIVL